jgi:hypothetical protein
MFFFLYWSGLMLRVFRVWLGFSGLNCIEMSILFEYGLLFFIFMSKRQWLRGFDSELQNFSKRGLF